MSAAHCAAAATPHRPPPPIPHPTPRTVPQERREAMARGRKLRAETEQKEREELEVRELEAKARDEFGKDEDIAKHMEELEAIEDRKTMYQARQKARQEAETIAAERLEVERIEAREAAERDAQKAIEKRAAQRKIFEDAKAAQTAKREAKLERDRVDQARMVVAKAEAAEAAVQAEMAATTARAQQRTTFGDRQELIDAQRKMKDQEERAEYERLKWSRAEAKAVEELRKAKEDLRVFNEESKYDDTKATLKARKRKKMLEALDEKERILESERQSMLTAQNKLNQEEREVRTYSNNVGTRRTNDRKETVREETVRRP